MIGVIRVCKESTIYATYTPPQCKKKGSNFEKGSKHEANGEVGGAKVLSSGVSKLLWGKLPVASGKEGVKGYCYWLVL